jgi:hypothetical protein
MKTRLFLICALASATLAAELPYAGKWKVNLAKSDFGQTTVTYESLPAGEWQTTAFGVTYKFKMDGKEYPGRHGRNKHLEGRRRQHVGAGREGQR